MLQFDNLIYTINNMSCWFILLLFIMTLTAIVYLYREILYKLYYYALYNRWKMRLQKDRRG